MGKLANSPNGKDLTCREFAEFLSDYLSRELSAAERAAFEAHLAECPTCVTYLDTFQKTIQLSKAAYADSEGGLPDEVPEELVQAILAARNARAGPSGD
jgi:anti-sigma factor RsiW